MRSPFGDAIDAGRSLPRRLRRKVDAQPEAVLVTLGGLSFLAGMLFGSRFLRILVSAAIPLGIQRFAASEYGPRFVEYLRGLLSETQPRGPNASV